MSADFQDKSAPHESSILAVAVASAVVAAIKQKLATCEGHVQSPEDHSSHANHKNGHTSCGGEPWTSIFRICSQQLPSSPSPCMTVSLTADSWAKRAILFEGAAGMNGLRLSGNMAEDQKQRFVEEHMHRQLRWSKTALENLHQKERAPRGKQPAKGMNQRYLQEEGRKEHVVEEHLHTQLRWSKEACDDLKLNGEQYTPPLPFDIQMKGIMHSPDGMEEDMHTHLHLEEDDHQEMRLEVDLHRQMRWPKDGHRLNGASAGNAQQQAPKQNTPSTEDDTQHFVEEHLHREMRWSKVPVENGKLHCHSSPDNAANGTLQVTHEFDPHAEKNHSQEAMQGEMQRQLRWLQHTFGGMQRNGEKHLPLDLQEHLSHPGANGLQHACQDNGHRDTHNLQWSQEYTRLHGERPSSPLDLKMHGLGYPPDGTGQPPAQGQLNVHERPKVNGEKHVGQNGFHRSNGHNGHIAAGGLQFVPSNGGVFHNGVKSNGFHNGSLNGSQVNGDVFHNGVKSNGVHHGLLNGSQGTVKAMQWSPKAYEELRLHGDSLRDLNMQGILPSFNGVCNDMCLQVEGMRALQDRLQWQHHSLSGFTGMTWTNGAKHLADLMEDRSNGHTNGIKSNGWHNGAGVPRLNGHNNHSTGHAIEDRPLNGVHPVEDEQEKEGKPLDGKWPQGKLNGHHVPEDHTAQGIVHRNGFQSNGIKPLANHSAHPDPEAFSRKTNGHAHLAAMPGDVDLQDVVHALTSAQTDVRMPIGKEDSPKALQNHLHWFEQPRQLNGVLADLTMRGMAHPRNGKDGPEEHKGLRDSLGWNGDGVDLLADLHLADAKLDKAPVPPHPPGPLKGCDRKGEDQQPSPLCWSKQAFDGIPLDGDKVLSLQPPLSPMDDSSVSSKNGHTTKVSAEDLKQQLQWSQHIIGDLMRENEDMRHQIEESEMKEKKWRAEKQRLHKEMTFQRDSISTLRDANAHLVNEVAELRALGDHLLTQVKQKMKNGILPKRMGTQ